MSLNPYLYFNGCCEAAFQFYAQVLGGKIVVMTTHAETPMASHVSTDWQDKVIHARLVYGDSVLMASDAPPEYFSKPQGFCVSLVVEEAAEAERLFTALSENGQVRMPLEETFWAVRFGMLVDQFDIPWMINCEKPM